MKNDSNLLLLSTLPINRKITNNMFININSEYEENKVVKYINMINIPIIKHLMIIANIAKEIKSKKGDDSIVICDVLNLSIFIGSLFGAKLSKKKCVGIVTDIPNIIYRSRMLMVLSKFLISKCDYYILLTKYMQNSIKTKGKPSIVIEGHADLKMINRSNDIKKKYKKKICHYAGRIDKKYGIEILINGFIAANIKNAELHIYGEGDFAKELMTICQKNNSIIYYGILPNELIIEEQIKSTLLINPRPSCEDSSKYAFPSKNMEYISSGTPLLTTLLPGMPNEYLKYVYIVSDETIEGYKNCLNDILNKSTEELHSKGLLAKNFALENKNNVLQAKKIIDMIKGN